jgi:hypothetical protein
MYKPQQRGKGDRTQKQQKGIERFVCALYTIAVGPLELVVGLSSSTKGSDRHRVNNAAATVRSGRGGGTGNRACSLPSRESAPAVATPQSGEEEEEMERDVKESSGRRRGLNLMSAKRAAAGVRLETRARNTVA